MKNTKTVVNTIIKEAKGFTSKGVKYEANKPALLNLTKELLEGLTIADLKSTESRLLDLIEEEDPQEYQAILDTISDVIDSRHNETTVKVANKKLTPKEATEATIKEIERRKAIKEAEQEMAVTKDTKKAPVKKTTKKTTEAKKDQKADTKKDSKKTTKKAPENNGNTLKIEKGKHYMLTTEEYGAEEIIVIDKARDYGNVVGNNVFLIFSLVTRQYDYIEFNAMKNNSYKHKEGYTMTFSPMPTK